MSDQTPAGGHDPSAVLRSGADREAATVPPAGSPSAHTSTAENALPFDYLPGGIDIARYFWHEIVMDDQPVPHRRGQYHGCDGIGLWRDGADYCYLWVQATVDHDMWMGYLLEIRTKQGGTESRDHLYLAAGASDLFEVEWRNKPYRPFDTPLDDCVDHHRDAMRWFVEREVGTIDEQNGGDQGIIDRAAALSDNSLPPGERNIE